MIRSSTRKVVAITIVIVGVLCTLVYRNKAKHDSAQDDRDIPQEHISEPNGTGTSNSKTGRDTPASLKNMLLQYNTKIDFHGRVIDQDGKPLRSARVSFDILLAGDL